MDPTKTEEKEEVTPVPAPITDPRTEAEKAKDAADAAAWLADPANRQQALLLAEQVQAVMGKTWFNLRAFMKHIQETREAAFVKLSTLGQFGLVARKGEGPDTRFKVTLTPQDRLTVLRLFEAEHQAQLKALRHAIAKVLTEITEARAQERAAAQPPA